MIIGHLPAGYVISRLLVRHAELWGVSAKAFIWAGVVGALAPDLDMLYFHLVDHRQHHHHTYFTHYPVLWLSLLVASASWLYLARTKSPAACAAIFSLNGFAHMFLDTTVGDIWWLAPWVNKPFALFTVPALYKPWWLNFLLHWSFAVELAVLVWAIYLWRKPLHKTLSLSAANDATTP
jgi:inner membrane protein